MTGEKLTFVLDPALGGKRLDQALAALLPQHSRARLQAWIRGGRVTVEGRVPRQRDRVTGGERIEIEPVYERHSADLPEQIPLDIVHEDEGIILVNKPAGLVVHPGAGNPRHTLLNALLNHAPDLSVVPRCGIVQRLDKDTSGIMVIARTPQMHTYLVDKLRKREITRRYDAIVAGTLTAGGSIDAPIRRHPTRRQRMAVREGGRNATTHYRIVKKLSSCTHLAVTLETGRTHQIRVHMAHIHHPIIGDPVYGTRRQLPKGVPADVRDVIRLFPRQALHARALTFVPPGSGGAHTWEAPLPEDMTGLLKALARGSR